jgi:hypothetical protein
MLYTLENGKSVNIPDKDLDNFQKTLDISREEAIEMWLDDNDYTTNATVEELTEKAKKNRISATIHGAKAENADKKAKKPREKKENPLKRQIIDAIFSGIINNIKTDGEVIITNAEKYIDFNVNGLEFTVNLVQHRPKKTK